MRISVEVDDPGYDVVNHCASVQVYFDGVLTPLVITADDETGYIKYYPLGTDGKCIFHEVNGERRRLVLEKYGKVKVYVDE